MSLSERIFGGHIDTKQVVAYLTKAIEEAKGQAESKFAFVIIHDCFCFMPLKNILQDRDIVFVITQKEVDEGLTGKRWDSIIEKIAKRVNKFNSKGTLKNETKTTQNTLWD